MRSHRGEREHVREVLAEVDPDEPLTASEIREHLSDVLSFPPVRLHERG